MTQKEAVVLTLQKQGSITSMEAFQDWGITRLAAIIHELRKEHEGYTIVLSEDVSIINRFGHSTTFSKYWVTDEGKLILSSEKK